MPEIVYRGRSFIEYCVNDRADDSSIESSNDRSSKEGRSLLKNSTCKIGKKARAAGRIAGLMMTGTLAGSFAASFAAPAALSVQAASWQENANYVFAYLTERLGYTEAAACGIMANIRCESTFNPHAWNAGGGSYGLCQWTGGRYGRLRNWCGSNGFDYTTIDGQLAYLEYELENHYPRVEEYLRSVENTADGAYDAGQYYCYHFEAPASRGSVSVYRGGLASGTFWESYRPAEWYKIDGVWHYVLRDGSYQTEWLSIEDDTFYLDKDGRRVSGWRSIDGDRYFFEDDGTMVTGWKKIDGRSYYFAEDGALTTGLIHSGDDWYLLDPTGIVQASADLAEYVPVWLAANQEPEQTAALAKAETEQTTPLTETVTEEPTALASAGKALTAGPEPTAAPTAEQDEEFTAATKALQAAAVSLLTEEGEPTAAEPGLLLPSGLYDTLPALSLAGLPGRACLSPETLTQAVMEETAAAAAETEKASEETNNGTEAFVKEVTGTEAEEERKSSAQKEPSEYFRLRSVAEEPRKDHTGKESAHESEFVIENSDETKTEKENESPNRLFSLPDMLNSIK